MRSSGCRFRAVRFLLLHAILLVATTSATKKVEIKTAKPKLQTSISTTTSTNTVSVPTITIGYDVYGHPVDLPLVGAGTGSHYNSSMAYQSLCAAFDVGYTFVDTAFNYHNEEGVGRAIRDCWNKSRQDLFVMTKVPGGMTTPEQIHAAHQQNLLELGLDYVDHLMFHFPADYNNMQHASPKIRQDGWKALEAIYKSGEARSIGVSHYCPEHVHDIIKVAEIMPSINQVQYHVGSGDVDTVRETCQAYNITFMSFSPLCGNCEYDAVDSLINGNLVTEIASHYDDVSGSQVALRFIVQQGIPVIPRSLSKEHLASNIDIFGFELSDDDMQQLMASTRPAAKDVRDCEVP